MIYDNDFQCWKTSSRLYKSMSLITVEYKSVHSTLGWIHFMHDSVLYTRQCRCIIRLLLNVHRLGRSICQLCTQFRSNTVHHILFECNCCDLIRGQLWQNVLHACPDRLKLELIKMDKISCTKFILNAMNCKYVNKWRPIYITLCQSYTLCTTSTIMWRRCYLFRKILLYVPNTSQFSAIT